MDVVYEVLKKIDNNVLWGIPMLILIIGTGILVSVRIKFLQVREFGYALKQTMGKTFKLMAGKGDKTLTNEKAISPFEAL